MVGFKLGGTDVLTKGLAEAARGGSLGGSIGLLVSFVPGFWGENEISTNSPASLSELSVTALPTLLLLLFPYF